MADLATVSKDVAEGLLYDLKQPLAKSALAELEKEGKASDTPLTGYREWRGLFDRLVKSAGIEHDAVRGWQAPKGLNVGALKGFSPDELKKLIVFTLPNAKGGIKEVKSATAQMFLKEFNAHYALPILEMLQEEVLCRAAVVLEDFWNKNAKFVNKAIQRAEYRNYQTFVHDLNSLAKDSNFPSKIQNGTYDDKYIVDTAKLLNAAQDKKAVMVLRGLTSNFSEMACIAHTNGNKALAETFDKTQSEYKKNVAGEITELVKLAEMVVSLREAAEARAAYRKYT